MVDSNESKEGINVLIVDDQITVLKGIAGGVDFARIGVNHVTTAVGAEKARKIMRRMPIHILLCDIEMPGENGISLVRWVNENYSETVCIFLTSHDSFTYAQQGIKLGCFDYVIQPASYQEIEAVVKRAIQKLKLEKIRDKMYNYGKYLEKNKQDILERIIKDLVSGLENCRSRGIHDFSEIEIGIDDNSMVFPALIDVNVEKNRQTEMAEDLVKFIIYNILCEYMESKHAKVGDATASLYSYWILFYSMKQADMDFQSVFEQFADYMKTYFQLDIICYLGKPVKVSLLYLDAQNIIRMRDNNADQQKKFYSIQDIRSFGGIQHQNLSYQISRWEKMLQKNHAKLVCHEIYAYIDTLVAEGKVSVDNLCFLHQQLTQMFFGILYEQNMEISNLFSDQYTYQDYMSSYKKIDRLKVAVQMMTEAVKGKNIREGQDDNVIEKAKKYILNNSSKELTVKMVSSYVGLSPEYLTKIFKQQTGYNLKNYIQHEKIEIAKELLETTSLSVSLVALQTGYTNFSHFTQIFKKMENVTPMEYRKQNAKKSKQEI